MSFLLNQRHVDYVLQDVRSTRNRLDHLFKLLGDVPPNDRRWFFPERVSSAYWALDNGIDFEEFIDRDFTAFQFEQLKLREAIDECRVVFLYVSETLNILRRLGCDESAKERSNALRALIDTMSTVAPQLLSRQRVEALIRSLHERLNNAPADMMLFRGRYESFCSQVVRNLLSKGSDLGPRSDMLV